MTIDVQALIAKRPHLKDPLELYAKWQRFHIEAKDLLPKERSTTLPEDSKCYPRENTRAVVQLFADIFELKIEEFEPLCQAMADGEIDFMRFPLDEFPSLSSLPYSQEEVVGLLFLLSRPYFLTLKESFPLDGSQWENGHCPLCSALPALTSIEDGPKRKLHCSFCGTSGPYRFIGCPGCGTVDTAKLNTIVSEDEPGFRVITCDECKTYVKVMESSVVNEMGVDLADMASLPLDIVAQEKGYVRMAPNPISLKKIA